MRNTVKSILVLVIALLVMSGSVFAQKNRGIRGGWIESEISKGGDSYLDAKYKSFYVGMFNDQKLIPMLYIYTALDYYQTGSKYNDNNKLILHYISIPLGLKLKIGPVQAFGGVHGAVKVSSTYNLLAQPISSEKFSTFDAGTFIGLGLSIAFIGAEVKYTKGLVDINRGYKNNFWQVGLTLWF